MKRDDHFGILLVGLMVLCSAGFLSAMGADMAVKANLPWFVGTAAAWAAIPVAYVVGYVMLRSGVLARL